MNSKDKTALVTGAAGLIGAIICRQLRANRARVAAADLDLHECEADMKTN